MGEEADGWMAVLEMAGKEGKEILGKNTDAALADGAFGLPWFVATNAKGEKETFWGVDHLARLQIIWGWRSRRLGGGNLCCNAEGCRIVMAREML